MRTLSTYMDDKKPKKEKQPKGYPKNYQQQVDREAKAEKLLEESRPTLSRIYTKWPALENLGTVTLKADKNFTRSTTGIGDIEYFDQKHNKVTYPNGTVVEHPNPGTHGVVYNPDTNNDQTIALDLLHGLKKSDTKYATLRNKFKKDFLKEYKEDFKHEWNAFNEQTNGDNDGKKQFKENWIDGQIRGLLFEGTEEDFKKSNYWPEAKSFYLKNKKIKARFEKLNNYLETGQ